MPDHIGAFLRASEWFARLGINITRVSYNKAVDSHTLFIDAEGTNEQLNKADIELEKIGYLQSNQDNSFKNAFLTMMDGVVSGKTGFTADAGYCYVGALEQNDEKYIVALLACGWPNNKHYKS